MNQNKMKKKKMPKAPKSLHNWVWGNFTINEKDQIVTDPGNDSGYKCPFPEYLRECETKRKDVFRKHIRTHKLNWTIPTIKEKCAYCEKSLDPNPQKKKIHIEVCPANVNVEEEEEVDNVVELQGPVTFENNNMEFIDNTNEVEDVTGNDSRRDLEEIIARIEEEKSDIRRKYDKEVEDKLRLQAEKSELKEKYEKNSMMKKEVII